MRIRTFSLKVSQIRKLSRNLLINFVTAYNSSDLIYFGTNTLASKEQITFLYEIKVAGKQQFKDYWNKTVVNPLSANPKKWPNTLKQFADEMFECLTIL